MSKLFITKMTILLALFNSCFMMPAPKINMEFKQDDLNRNLVDSLEYFTNAAYKMNKEYTNEFIVAIIRMNSLNVPTSTKNVKIMLELLVIQNDSFVDESLIQSMLTPDQIADLKREFPNGLKSKKDIKTIRNEYPELNEKLTCTPEIVDAHWAYLSGTGDLDIVNKLIESTKVVNTPCCFSCIEWSVPSQAILNKDVYDKLIEINNSLPEKSKEWFSRYVPELGDVMWENNYQDMND